MSVFLDTTKVADFQWKMLMSAGMSRYMDSRGMRRDLYISWIFLN